ncbi:hypothetical protein [Lactococcus ileimucosae]|uniref:hypothetical protein n=1 Tax=Lactococcus ileimucosae TaxID=2941329 RepID=UPI003514B33A
MRKTLLNASFEESNRITANLFKGAPFWYDTGGSGSQKISARLFNIIPLIMFSVLFYALGVFLPMNTTAGDVLYGLEDIWMGIGYFQWLRPILIFAITTWSVTIVINIFPKSNYMIQRIFGVTILLLMLLLMFLALMPMALGMTLGAVGWVGFSIICLYGMSWYLDKLSSKIQSLKLELYRELVVSSPSLFSKIWKFLKKIWLVAAMFMVPNIVFFRIGMWGDFTLWSFVWIIGGGLYFGILVATTVLLKMVISDYYFAKYSNQYRVLWKVSDEQWFGKRKAKRLAKKRLKEGK